MFYKIQKHENPLKRTECRYYAAPEYGEEMDIRFLANEISKSCTLTMSDVVAVLESLVEKLPVYLKSSYKIRLGELGIMKLSFSSNGQDKAEDVSTRDIKETRVLFTPSVTFKRELKNVSFSKKGAVESEENAKEASGKGEGKKENANSSVINS